MKQARVVLGLNEGGAPEASQLLWFAVGFVLAPALGKLFQGGGLPKRIPETITGGEEPGAARRSQEGEPGGRPGGRARRGGPY